MWKKENSKRFLPTDIGRRFRSAEHQDPGGIRRSKSTTIPRVRVETYGQSQIGNLRRVNEDQFFTMPLGPNQQGIHYLLGVADGIGGAPGGERASAMAAETFQQFIREERDLLLRSDRN